MKFNAGVASTTLLDTELAGKTIAGEALSRAGIKHADFAFLIISDAHDYDIFLKSVQSVLGKQTVIAGGSSIGIITNDALVTEGASAAIMVIAADEVHFTTEITPGLSEGEELCGRKAGKKLKQLLKAENPNLILFYDGLGPTKEDGVKFIGATPILKGIGSEIGDWPPTAGVGLVTLSWANCKLWNEDLISGGSIMSLIISGNIRMDTTIMHGCKPASDYHKITGISENVILEIDGKPATDVVIEHLGNPAEIDWKSAPFFITLGMNKGDKYGPFREEDYVNRMVMGVDEKRKGLDVVDVDFQVGDEFQFMRRSIEPGIVSGQSHRLLNSLTGRRPLFALYISCAGRIKKLYGSEKEEAEEVQEALGDLPLIGMYSGVEIARVKNKLMPLDWTGVLCVFSEPV